MAKTLLDFGDRVQESIFECRLEDERVIRMVKRLEKIVNQEDSLLIYAVCANCESKTLRLGRKDERKSEKVFIV
jgi:CRISPR-associated protein Cas2